MSDDLAMVHEYMSPATGCRLPATVRSG